MVLAGRRFTGSVVEQNSTEQKKPLRIRWFHGSISSMCVDEIASCGLIPSGVLIRMIGGCAPDQVRIGGGMIPWVYAGPRLQVCTFFYWLASCLREVLWTYTHSHMRLEQPQQPTPTPTSTSTHINHPTTTTKTTTTQTTPS